MATINLNGGTQTRQDTPIVVDRAAFREATGKVDANGKKEYKDTDPAIRISYGPPFRNSVMVPDNDHGWAELADLGKALVAASAARMAAKKK